MLGNDPKSVILEYEKLREKQRDYLKEYAPSKRYMDKVWAQCNLEQKKVTLQKIYDDSCLERIRELFDSGDYEELYLLLEPWQEMNLYCKQKKLKREDFMVNSKLDQLVEQLGLGFELPS